MKSFFKSKHKIYLYYTFFFLIASVITFWYFSYYNRSFVWKSDGLYQHYSSLSYYGKYLRTILKNIFINHTFEIPMWDMSIGYGSDILTTLNYYVIGDPLTLLSVLVPASSTEILYGFLIIFRLYLAGTAFIIYCRYHNASQIATLIGALSYAFCGFALFASVRHPAFTNPMIYLPLFLTGIDQIFDNKKPWLFIIMTALAAISNFYFFYMICILMFLYAVFRYIRIFGRIHIVHLAKWLGKFILYFSLGTGMSLVVLLPSVLSVFATDRMKAKHYIPILFSASFYKQLFGDFLGSDFLMASSRYWTVLGFTPLVLIAVFILFGQRRKYLDLKLGLCLLTLIMLIPIGGYIMNGFSYVSNRWGWGFAFLLCYILVKVYPHIFILSRKQAVFLMFCIITYAGICYSFSESRSLHSMIGTGISILICMVIVLNIKFTFSLKILNTFFLCSTLVYIGINAYFLYSPSETGYVDTFRKAGTPEKLLTSSSQGSILHQLKDDTLFRFDQFGVKSKNNTAMHQNLYSTDYYFSVANSTITQFFDEQRAYTVVEQLYNNLDARSILDRLASVKYFITNKDKPQYRPYSYDTLVASNKKYDVYTTETWLPFGYTYSSYIPRNQYDTMTTAQKQQALLQGVILSDSKLPATKTAFNDIRPDIHITTNEKIKIEGTSYIASERAKMTIEFTPVPNCEVYLLLDDVTYDGQSTNFAFLASMDNVEKNIPVYTNRNSFYSGKDDFLCNLGYFKNPSGKITFTLPTGGTYHIQDLYVICQPMEQVNSMVQKLNEDVLENIVFSANQVTGTISLDTTKELVLSIPYTKGWSATVNGQEAPLHQANTMYMGLELPAGEHSIVLSYVTPGLKIGLVISIFSFLLFLMLIIYYRRTKK